VLIRNARKEDAAQISALNDVFVAVTSPMDEARFLHLLALSGYCLVAEVESTVVGFVIAMRSGVPYDNDNYRWFDARLSEMVYVDRIVLASDTRSHGIGAQLYDRLGELALADGCCVMTAEMDVDPPNTHSLHFHAKRGFCEKGERILAGGKKVSMQSCPLK